MAALQVLSENLRQGLWGSVSVNTIRAAKPLAAYSTRAFYGPSLRFRRIIEAAGTGDHRIGIEYNREKIGMAEVIPSREGQQRAV